MQPRQPITPRPTTGSSGRLLPTDQTRTGSFRGRSIQLMNLSKTGSFMDNLKRFVRFCWDPAYREKVRDAFLEDLKSEVKPIGQGENEIGIIQTRINDILNISDIDMPENKKMELILFIIDQSSADIKEKILHGDSTLPQIVRTSYTAASNYFEIKKNEIRSKILAPVLNEFQNLRTKLSELYQAKLTIHSQKALDSEKTAFSKNVIDVLHDNNIPIAQTKDLVQKLIDDPDLNLSEKEGFALSIHVYAKYGEKVEMKTLLEKIVKSDIPESDKIELIQSAVRNDPFKDIEINIARKRIMPLEYFMDKTMASIDRMAMATAKPSDADAIQAMLESIKIQDFDNDQFGTFENCQKAYAEAVIKEMAKMYAGNEKALTSLKHNVTELLKFDPAIVLSKTQKADLIAQVGKTAKDAMENKQDLTQVEKKLVEDPATKTRLAEIAKMRKNTMDLLALARENIVGTHLIDGLITECERVAEGGDGNLKKVKRAFKAIQLTCVKRCTNTLQQPRYLSDLAYYWGGEILQATTLLSPEERKPLNEIVENAKAKTTKIYQERINTIANMLATDDLMSKMPQFDETLGTLHNKYLKMKFDPLKPNELEASYLKESIQAILEITDNKPAALNLLKRNVEQILTNPSIEFSKAQQESIRADLLKTI